MHFCFYAIQKGTVNIGYYWFWSPAWEVVMFLMERWKDKCLEISFNVLIDERLAGFWMTSLTGIEGSVVGV